MIQAQQATKQFRPYSNIIFHIYISIFIYILSLHQSSTSQAIIQYQYPTNPVPFNMRKLFFSILILSLFLFSKQSALPHNNVTDLAALLSFKSQVYDPTDTLDSSWLTNTFSCKWIDVNCSAKGQRIIALYLKGLSLSGTISPMLGNLSFIKGLDSRRIYHLQFSTFPWSIFRWSPTTCLAHF
jgi:Leucine rich repeat N-terminal domain